jgi:hypothetical protein
LVIEIRKGATLLNVDSPTSSVTAGDPLGKADAIHGALVAASAVSARADELVIAVEVRERLERATDESYWTSAEDVIRQFGQDPSDFGLTPGVDAPES